MKNILLFEYFNPNLELKNDLQNHLSQYPFISYSLTDSDKNIIISFNKDINTNYGLGLIDHYEKEIINKYPLKVKITGVKNLDDYEEFKGKTIIQNIEKVDFPDLGIEKLESKIDTGAATSSIHCHKIKIDRQKKKVSFIALDDSYPQYTGKMITMPIHSEISVQSSNGVETPRVLIKSVVIIKGKKIETYISLANREELDYPVLIGKDILSGRFLVQAGI